MKKLLIVFAAGCIGALANSLTVWGFGDLGITSKLGVALAPALSPAWLYPRIVWGGLWGLIFTLSLHQSKPLLKGSILSLFRLSYNFLSYFPFTHTKA